MKQPLQKLRRFFSRSKKFNATANPDALSAAYDDDDGASRLSGAFVVVLLLHIIALVGVFAFARIKDSRSAARSASPPQAQPAAPAPAPPVKNTPVKQAAPTVASTPAPATPTTTANAVVTPSVAGAALLRNETKAPTPEPRSARGERMHLVKTGENLTKIASTYNVNVADLVKVNQLKNENDVRAGQELKIPEAGKTTAIAKATPEPKKPTETAMLTYTVRKNDNLVKISNTLGVKTDDLMRLNNIKDPKKLQEGQKLKVPKKG